MIKIRALIAAILSWIVVSNFWALLEKMMYGEIRPDNADSIISLIILALFYLLYANWLETKRLREKVKQLDDPNVVIGRIVN